MSSFSFRRLRRLAPWALALTMGCGTDVKPTAGPDAPGADEQDRGAPPPATTDASGEAASTPPKVAGLTAFVFDQGMGRMLRLADRNGDGDAMDEGEATVYFERAGGFNSQGLVATSADEVLTTDSRNNEVLRLEDKNGDGDAMDEGEHVLWFGGALPGEKGAMQHPVALAPGPAGSVYLIDNDFTDGIESDGVYHLLDKNKDGDALDEGEASLHFDFARPAILPQVLDAEFAPEGTMYAVNVRNPEDGMNRSLDALSADGQWRELIDSSALYTLSEEDERLLIHGNVQEVLYHAALDAPVIAGSDVRGIPHLVALRDNDGSGRVDRRSEIRVLLDAEIARADGADLQAIRDLVYLADESLLLVDSGSQKLYRVVDQNQDGDYHDAGEIHVFYDGAAATPMLGSPFSTHAYLPAP